MSRTASRWASLLLFTGAIVIAGWLLWRCYYDQTIRFLPQVGRAAWIVYPNVPDVLAHPIAGASNDLATVFRRSFILPRAPVRARMRVCALETFAVKINDRSTAP